MPGTGLIALSVLALEMNTTAEQLTAQISGGIMLDDSVRP